MTILFYMRYRSSIMPPSPTPVPDWKDAATEHRNMLIRKKKEKRLRAEEEALLMTLLDILDD